MKKHTGHVGDMIKFIFPTFSIRHEHSAFNIFVPISARFLAFVKSKSKVVNAYGAYLQFVPHDHSNFKPNLGMAWIRP